MEKEHATPQAETAPFTLKDETLLTMLESHDISEVRELIRDLQRPDPFFRDPAAARLPEPMGWPEAAAKMTGGLCLAAIIIAFFYFRFQP